MLDTPTDAALYCINYYSLRIEILINKVFRNSYNIATSAYVSMYIGLKYLKFSPYSVTGCSNFPSRLVTNLFKWAVSSAFHISSSQYNSKGSRFIFNVPENNTGSYHANIEHQLVQLFYTHYHNNNNCRADNHSGVNTPHIQQMEI